MPRKYPGYSINRDGVTQGLLDKFSYCRQHCRWFLDGWNMGGTGGFSVALWFGTVWHKLMEESHKDLDRGEKIVAYPKDVKVDDTLPALELRANDIVSTAMKEALAECASPEESAEAENAAMMLRIMFPVFVRRFWRQDYQCRWVGLEKEFHEGFKTALGPVLLRGKRDGLVNTTKNKFRVVEYKTKSRIDPLALQDTVLYDGQVHLYALATELEMLKADAVGEVTYHLVRRPGEYQGKRENEDEFKARITDKIQSEPDHYFYRFTIGLTKPQKVLFRAELAHRLSEFGKWVRGELHTYRNTGSCVGRNYNCEFIPVCASDNPAKALQSLCVQREQVFPELG